MTYGTARKRTGLYRSRHGIILGVCRGIAEYLGFSVVWTRAIALALLFFSGLWPIVGWYLLAALLMKREPLIPEEEQEFHHTSASSRRMTLHHLQHSFDKLNRRIQRLEHVVTTRDYDWEQRLYE